MERLVERAARRCKALGEHVDRHAVDGERDQYLALVGCQLAADALADRSEQLPALGGDVGPLGSVGEAVPGLGVEHDLAVLPGAPADANSGLEQRELVDPGREAARAAEVVELGQHGHERVVGGLHGEVVELLAAHERHAGPAPRHLEPRRAHQQLVQSHDRRAVFAAQGGDPGCVIRRRRQWEGEAPCVSGSPGCRATLALALAAVALMERRPAARGCGSPEQADSRGRRARAAHAGRRPGRGPDGSRRARRSPRAAGAASANRRRGGSDLASCVPHLRMRRRGAVVLPLPAEAGQGQPRTFTVLPKLVPSGCWITMCR